MMVCLTHTSSFFSLRFKYRRLSSSPSPSGARPVAVSSSLHTLGALRITPREHLRYESHLEGGRGSVETKESEDAGSEQDDDMPSPTEENIAGIHVPRHKYISVAKVDLLDAILSLFRSEQDVEEFKRLAAFLDSIIHAEHKGILEEMRTCYSSICCTNEQLDGGTSNKIEEDESTKWSNSLEFFANSRRIDDVDKQFYVSNSLDLRKLFGQAPLNGVPERRTVVENKFQRSFMELLRDAQFEELSVEDLLFTDSLNNDYLLRLPINVDWKRVFKSNAIIFRRGYATERQQGLLIVEKLDYLQSKLLQEIFISLSKPVKQIGRWLNKVFKDSQEAHNIEIWVEKMKVWFKQKYSSKNPFSSDESIVKNQLEKKQITDDDIPVWLAAQKAVSHYEGLLSSVGPRGRLIRRLLAWIGIISLPPEAPIGFDNKVYSATSSRANFIPRITLRNIWEPASKESCGYNIWRMLKTAVYVLFSRSTLQEPAFQELVLLYTDKENQNGNKDRAGINPLQLKIYEKIPIPDLPVIFPHKKLSFRILDTVRLDIASILGLLAYFINYKFENIASSPSAIFLDVIAISALIIYVSRVVLGYKQTWDRYQLLVNRTLYEKTLASGFGSVHFLLDASEQQQFKEAILVYAISLHPESYQASSRKNIRDSCEKFVYDRFKQKIEMPVDKAVETLMRLGLLSEIAVQGNILLQVVPCSDAFETLRKRWNDLLEQQT